MAPRKKRTPKKVEEPQKPDEPLKRRFCEVSRISKHLYCSICQEVYNDPQQLPCQHTFCKQCILQWSENHKAAAVPCPFCRKMLNNNQLFRNLLAYQIINDLEIFCSNRGCDWRGTLDNITHHLPNCTYGQGQIPDWFKRYLESKADEFQKEEDDREKMDSSLRDIYERETNQPLALRLYGKLKDSTEAVHL